MRNVDDGLKLNGPDLGEWKDKVPDTYILNYAFCLRFTWKKNPLFHEQFQYFIQFNESTTQIQHYYWWASVRIRIISQLVEFNRPKLSNKI